MADVIIVYDTKTGNTAKVAEEIYNGVKESGVSVEIKNVDDVTVDDLTNAKGVILGSPNINDTYSTKMRDLVNTKLLQAKPVDKVGAAFGTYKWNEGNLKELERDMTWIGVRIIAGSVNVHKHSDKGITQKLRELGKKVGEETKRL
jgi:flavorubredoxin